MKKLILLATIALLLSTQAYGDEVCSHGICRDETAVSQDQLAASIVQRREEIADDILILGSIKDYHSLDLAIYMGTKLLKLYAEELIQAADGGAATEFAQGRLIDLERERNEIDFLMKIASHNTRFMDGTKPTFHGYECIQDCSGHKAGYKWAEENDIGDIDNCSGNSDSFYEGCKAYVEETS